MSVHAAVSIPTAFAFGLASFLSPCVLPLVPAYLSYMSGASVEELMTSRGSKALKRTGVKSVLFVLGFSAVFIAMGATATSVGRLLDAWMDTLMKIGGVVIIIFGLHMLGVFRIKALYMEKRFHGRLQNVGLVGAFLIGVMFAFGWTPCTGPVLAGILALAADSETLLQGVGLLAIYSLGLGIPFLITGFATGTALRALARFKKHFRTVEIASGALMIAVGVLIFQGNLQVLSSIFSKWFPGLG
ncbi:MAG TPA: cytochrome c biogenesis protein CcdA [Armatimonadota bacterium]|nr:cytochrome c biogenesis protein CcdA [Armatimonadota bacterium]